MSKRHLIIPDLQCEKGHPTRHIEWAAQAIDKYKPDVVVCLGDVWEMGSLSTYDGPGSAKMEGARIEDDIEAGNQAFRILNTASHKCKKVLLRGNHECLSPDTEVLVKGRGFVPYTEVRQGNLVWSLNKDASGCWKPVLGVVEKEYSGRMVQIESRTVSVMMTPNHRTLYTSNQIKDRYKEVTAESLPTSCDMFVSAQGVGDYVTYSDDELRLAAWLCTDSYISDKQVWLYQSGDKAQTVRELLSRLGVQYRENSRDRNITEICGKVLKKPPQTCHEFLLPREVLNTVTTYSNKRLPDWAAGLSPQQWEVFLDTLIFADGTMPTKGVNSRVFYGKKAMCDEVQACAVVHGWRASLTEYRPDHWRVNLCRGTVARQDSVKSEVDYSGVVWCLVVQDNENFLVRRKNKCHFTGNCRLTKAVAKDARLAGVLGEHMFLSPGWQVVPYVGATPGQVEIDGVVYAHYFAQPNTGKSIGGTIQNRLAKIGQSFVQGHVQGLMQGSLQLATGRMIQGIQCGSYYIADCDYKGVHNRHWRGIVVLNEVRKGEFCEMPLSIDYLCREYEGMGIARFLQRNYRDARSRFSLATRED